MVVDAGTRLGYYALLCTISVNGLSQNYWPCNSDLATLGS